MQDPSPKYLRAAAFAAFTILTCGIELRTEGWTVYPFLYPLCGVVLSTPVLWAFIGLGVIYGLLLAGPLTEASFSFYLGAQFLAICACALTGNLDVHFTPDRTSSRFTDRFGGQLGRVLFWIAVLLIAYAVLFRTAWPKPVGWAVVLLMVYRHLPKRPAPTIENRRKRLLTALTFTVSLVLSIAALEIAVRALFGPPQYASRLMGPHPEAISTLNPGASDAWKVRGDDGVFREFSITTSSQGLRDRDYGPKSPDEYRILMLGDSYVFGQGLEQDETIPKRLEARLRDAFPKKNVSVVNAGVGGYSPWQERILLNERGFSLEPDVVVLQLFPQNDVPDSLVVWDEYLEAFNAEWRRRLLDAKLTNLWPVKVRRWLRSHSQAFNLMKQALGERFSVSRLLFRLRIAPEEAKLTVPPSADRPSAIEIDIREPYPLLQKAWDKYEHDIAGIVIDARERGLDTVIFAIPSREVANPELWRDLVTMSDMPEARYEYARGMKRTRALAHRLDVPYVELLPRFSSLERPDDLYYVLDGHLNPRGVRVVVDALAAHFRDRWQSESEEADIGGSTPSSPR